MENNSVICLESSAFRKLVDTVVGYVKEKHMIQHDKWITGEEAMRLLNVTSKSTMQQLRDTGKIRFSQPMHKVLLYDRDSVLEYIESHAKETF